MELNPAFKRNGLFIYATTWIRLKNIRLIKKNIDTKNAHFIMPKEINLIYSNRREISGCLGLGVRRMLLQRELRELFEVMQIFCILTGGSPTDTYF